MILIHSWCHCAEQIHISIMKTIKIGDIETMTDEYGSSGSFGSRVRSNSIGHDS